MAALNANPKKKRICGMFNSHCTVDVGDVYNDKGDFILPAGDIWLIRYVAITNAY